MAGLRGRLVENPAGQGGLRLAEALWGGSDPEAWTQAHHRGESKSHSLTPGFPITHPMIRQTLCVPCKTFSEPEEPEVDEGSAPR